MFIRRAQDEEVLLSSCVSGMGHKYDHVMRVGEPYINDRFEPILIEECSAVWRVVYFAQQAW